jgi:hypothetical protein
VGAAPAGLLIELHAPGADGPEVRSQRLKGRTAKLAL